MADTADSSSSSDSDTVVAAGSFAAGLQKSLQEKWMEVRATLNAAEAKKEKKEKKKKKKHKHKKIDYALEAKERERLRRHAMAQIPATPGITSPVQEPPRRPAAFKEAERSSNALRRNHESVNESAEAEFDEFGRRRNMPIRGRARLVNNPRPEELRTDDFRSGGYFDPDAVARESTSRRSRDKDHGDRYRDRERERESHREHKHDRHHDSRRDDRERDRDRRRHDDNSDRRRDKDRRRYDDDDDRGRKRDRRRHDDDDDYHRYWHHERHRDHGDHRSRSRERHTNIKPQGFDLRANATYNDEHRPAYLTKKVMEHADEIKRRKALWQKGREQPLQGTISTTSEQSAAEKWAATVEGLEGDEKQREKFKHLIGMRESTDVPQTSGAVEIGPAEMTSAQRRAEMMTAQLHAQYEHARMTSVVGRGRGLGFVTKAQRRMQMEELGE